MVNIINFTQRMVKLAEFRKNLAAYLSDKMSVVAPNLSALIGDTVAARLISKVGRTSWFLLCFNHRHLLFVLLICLLSLFRLGL